MLYHGRDSTEFTIEGLTRDGKLERIPALEQIEGKNPTQNMISLDKDGENIQKEQALAIYGIKGTNNKEGFSIKKGQYGIVEVKYFRRISKDLYINSKVPQAHTTERDIAKPEVRELMSTQYNSQTDIEEPIETFHKLEDMKKQEIPDEIDPTMDGIQLRELNIEEVKLEMVKAIMEDDKLNYNLDQANKIAKKVVDEGKRFEIATKEVDDQAKEAKEEDENVQETSDNDDVQKVLGENPLSRRGY